MSAPDEEFQEWLRSQAQRSDMSEALAWVKEWRDRVTIGLALVGCLEEAAGLARQLGLHEFADSLDGHLPEMRTMTETAMRISGDLLLGMSQASGGGDDKPVEP